MSFLYDVILQEFGRKTIENLAIPSVISNNLKQDFNKRNYQKEAFQRFLLCYNEPFAGKPKNPLHLLYNMATGSGKTLIMAGLILYLYQQGYRNFLFFVHSKNLILKTKENFLNINSSKYLFNNSINIDDKEVFIREVAEFSTADSENINIKFTTIQQLHLDLITHKENSITFEDFANLKLVLIADEAHHLNSATKGGELFESWERTVLKIFQQNYANILLEFTATLSYENQEITKKYQDKVLFKYDLAKFRKDGFSKEIDIICSPCNEKQRIIKALILNLYRQELASKHHINLKPVILFKAKKTVAESQQNQENFHRLIEELSFLDIEEIANSINIEQVAKNSESKIMQKALSFFANQNIAWPEVTRRIKNNFQPTNCLCANNDADAEKNQILLNTLEDSNNPIRAVFAVHKLNEGWDVLNLFDIVRLYEKTDGKAEKPSKTTIAEAQLIGRGARYFPFALQEGQDKFIRKFDNDTANDLRVLEELFYHTKQESEYIKELTKAMVEMGLCEDNLVSKKLILKDDFKKTNFYKNAKVVVNKKIPKDYYYVKSFSDLGVMKKNFIYQLSSAFGNKITVFNHQPENAETKEVKEILFNEIPKNVIYFALAKNKFFDFDNLSKIFKNISATSDFINNRNYLGGLVIEFIGLPERLKFISNNDYLLAVQQVLSSIETEIKNNSTKFTASGYYFVKLKEIFKDKEIRVEKNSEKAYGQENFLVDKNWYVYNANYGTSEEKAFIEMFSKKFTDLQLKFNNIYIIRNERELKIYNKLGQAFEPDFLLLCEKKEQEQSLIYQVFIEPKGAHLAQHDKWKEDFLLELNNTKEIIKLETDHYRITGLPFYNQLNENDFKKKLEECFN